MSQYERERDRDKIDKGNLYFYNISSIFITINMENFNCFTILRVKLEENIRTHIYFKCPHI